MIDITIITMMTKRGKFHHIHVGNHDIVVLFLLSDTNMIEIEIIYICGSYITMTHK